MKFLIASKLVMIATICRMATGFLVNKIIAVYFGPSGLALISNYQNFLQIVLTISNCGVTTGITRYSALYSNQPTEFKSLLNTSFVLCFVCTTIASITLFVGSEFFSLQIFGSREYSHIIKILSFTVIFFVFNSLNLSILNGLERRTVWFFLTILQALLSLIITGGLALKYGFVGAVTGLTINQVFLSLFILVKKFLRAPFPFFSVDLISRKILIDLLKYSFVTSITVLLLPILLIYLRHYIASIESLEVVGIWQSINVVSTALLMLSLTVLKVYIIPRISKAKEQKEIHDEIMSIISVVLPVLILISIVSFILGERIMTVLFSNQFTVAASYLTMNLIGDSFKIVGSIFGLVLVARSKHRHVLFLNIFFPVLLIFWSIVLFPLFGLLGLVLSNAVTQLLFLIFTVLMVRYVVKF